MWSDLERQESSEAFQNLRGLEVWPQHANFEYIVLHLSTISSLIMRVDTRILANISGSHVALCRGHESSFLPLCFPIHCSQDKVEYQQAGTTSVQKKSALEILCGSSLEDAIHFQHQFLIRPRKLTCPLKNGAWKKILSFWNDPHFRGHVNVSFRVRKLIESHGMKPSLVLQAMSLMWSYVPGLVFYIDSSHWTVPSMWCYGISIFWEALLL